MKKLLVFGGKGFIGGNIVQLAVKKGWDVFTAGQSPDKGINDPKHFVIDITDKEAVGKIIGEILPDVVVNACAVANIDKAEVERELAFDVNVAGAMYIAESCIVYGARYIYFSSDAVFSGEGTCYTEEDEPDPINFYGKTKAMAEKAILEVNPRAAILRISFVLGFHRAGGNSFLSWLEQKIKEGGEVICPKEEIRTPIDVLTLSDCVLEIAENDYCGVLNIGSTDSINRYELVKKIIKSFGRDSNFLKLQTTQTITPGRVPRHRNGVISVVKAQEILKTKMLKVDDGILRVISER